MPKDEPLAANPPDGAIIDYYLPDAGSGPVTLTLYGSNGVRFKTLSSADKLAAADARILKFAPEWVPARAKISAAPGMHRVVWNIHYGDEPPPDDPFETTSVWAPPGTYTVELTANGHTVKQLLTVKPDPRVRVTPAALVREFELAVKVETAAKQASAAADQATELLDSLSKREGQVPDRRPSIQQLMSRVSAVSGIPVPGEARSMRPDPAPPPGSLKSLSEELANLRQAVDGADADPSPDSRAAYAVLSNRLNMALRDWQQVRQSALATLNDRSPAEHAGSVQP